MLIIEAAVVLQLPEAAIYALPLFSKYHNKNNSKS